MAAINIQTTRIEIIRKVFLDFFFSCLRKSFLFIKIVSKIQIIRYINNNLPPHCAIVDVAIRVAKSIVSKMFFLVFLQCRIASESRGGIIKYIGLIITVRINCPIKVRFSCIGFDDPNGSNIQFLICQAGVPFAN